MAYITNNGVRIYYERYGQGPTIVMHHGTTQTLKRWHMCGYVDAFRADYDLILIDPRGHGGSDKPHDPAQYTLEIRVDDVVRVLDDAGVEKATFWGYSDGGRVGYGLAAMAPQRLAALIVGGHPPGAYSAPKNLTVTGDDDPVTFFTKMRQVIGATGEVPPERLKEWYANDLRAIAAALRDEPSLEYVLPTIDVPCLLYAGERDMFFAEIKRCVSTIPKGTFFSVPNMGHPAAFWQKQLVVPHARAFLESVYKPAFDLQPIA
jgi:pimeloyl-ACP methyl ester carboxylesterase